MTFDEWTLQQVEQVLEFAYQIEVEKRRLQYKPSIETSTHIKNVAKWLKEGNGFGLLLMGFVGNGKTTMMRALAGTVHLAEFTDMTGKRCEVKIIDSNQITRMCRDDYEQFRKVCSSKFLALDDLGREPVEVKDYGNVINPIVDLIQYRYDEQLPLIITTNLNTDMIDQRYGRRIADRLKEMMHLETFEEGSFR